MKKGKALNALQKVLVNWEDSCLDRQCCKELLAALEKIGMKPPLNEKEFEKTGDYEKSMVWDKKDNGT